MTFDRVPVFFCVTAFMTAAACSSSTSAPTPATTTSDASTTEAGDAKADGASDASSGDDGGDDAADSANATDASCPRVAQCSDGSTWDLALCACVLTAADAGLDAAPSDASGGSGCHSASDCTGALPALCQSCPAGGGSGCAHHVCTLGVCSVAYCN